MRHALLFSVFVIASCGLAYELIAGALSSYLLGDSVTQFSTVIGTYLFAMGAGSWLSKYITRDLIGRFIQIELMVGLLGGFSAIGLFLVFTWLSGPFKLVLYLAVFGVGVLVGLEIPLVMRILKRELDFKDLVSQVLTFDYLGALAVSILFPLFLAPQLGMVRTGLLFGLLNVAVALWALHLFREQLPARRRQIRPVTGRTRPNFAWPASASSSPAGAMICACSSTTTCNFLRRTNTAITKPSSILDWPVCPGPSACWYSVAAMAWPSAKSSNIRKSNRSRWSILIRL